MESGTIKWFNVQKRFGFISPDPPEEPETGDLWFHFNDGQIIDAVKDQPEPQFVGPTLKGKRLRDPVPGDRVRFWRDFDSQGRAKAYPWGYESHYERARKIIAKRPPPTMYRVLKTMNAIGEQPGEPETLWTGSDLSEALRKFPLPRGHQSPSADPLLSYWSDPDNIFEVRHWWEKQKPDGSWEQCNDPRPLSPVLRQFEAINR